MYELEDDALRCLKCFTVPMEPVELLRVEGDVEHKNGLVTKEPPKGL